MVEHAVDVLDPLGQLRDPQDEVPVLRAFEARAKTACASRELCAVNSKVRNKILPQKKIRIPIGFEVRFIAATLFIDLIFVAVD